MYYKSLFLEKMFILLKSENDNKTGFPLTDLFLL